MTNLKKEIESGLDRISNRVAQDATKSEIREFVESKLGLKDIKFEMVDEDFLTGKAFAFESESVVFHTNPKEPRYDKPFNSASIYEHQFTPRKRDLRTGLPYLKQDGGFIENGSMVFRDYSIRTYEVTKKNLKNGTRRTEYSLKIKCKSFSQMLTMSQGS
jgi:hypothetical protein